MEFGKYLNQGLWGAADKALPVVYGAAFLLLVIRILPAEEFGNFVLVQEVFIILSGLAAAFALQPLVKFSAEEQRDGRDVRGAAAILNLGFLIVCTVALLGLRTLLARALNAGALAHLLLFAPLMLWANLVRNFTLMVLQARFEVRAVFWVDAAHFAGAPLLMLGSALTGRLTTALDLIVLNLVSLCASSVVGVVLARRHLSLTFRPDPGTLREVWDYGRYSLGGSVSYMFTARADSFILSAFTGPVQVAEYNSVKIFARVYEMMTQVVQMFLLPAASRLSARGDRTGLTALVEKSTLFGTLAMLPLLVLFLAGADVLVDLLYGGKYAGAAPLLRILGVLSLFVPVASIAATVLVGIGQARAGFIVSTQTLVASAVFYVLLIPPLGSAGAALGYLLSAVVLALLGMHRLHRFVPTTLRGTLRRTRDITTFLASRLGRAR